MLILLAYLVILGCTWCCRNWFYTSSTAKSYIQAAISDPEKGRLYAFVNTYFPVAKQATIGVPPAVAVATLQGYLSLSAGKLTVRRCL